MDTDRNTNNLALLKNNPQSIVNLCLDSSTGVGSVQDTLESLVRTMNESLALLSDGGTNTTQEKEFECYINVSQRIADILQKNARENGVLKYFFMGAYQNELKHIRAKWNKQKEKTYLYSVVKRKHIASIMQILYKNTMINHAELSHQLPMNKGNLSREMQRLVVAGLVEQRNAGKYKYYNLSAQGLAYYKEYLMPPSQTDNLADENIVSVYVVNPRENFLGRSYRCLDKFEKNDKRTVYYKDALESAKSSALPQAFEEALIEFPLQRGQCTFREVLQQW